MNSTTLPITTGITNRQLHLLLDWRTFLLSGAWQWDLPADILYCSNSLLSLPSHVQAPCCLVHPDDVPLLRAQLDAGGAGAFHFRVVAASGAVYRLEGVSVAMEEADGFSELFEEARQQAYAARERHVQHEALLLRAAAADRAERDTGTGTWWFVASAGTIQYSDGIYRIHGLPPQSLNTHPQTFAGFVHPDDAPVVSDTLLLVLQRELPLELEYRIFTAGGAERRVRLQVHWQFGHTGASVATGVLRDISAEWEQDAAAAASATTLRVRSAALRLLESGGRAGHWLYDTTTRKLEVSEGTARLHGVRGKAATFEALLAAVVPADQPALQATFVAVQAGNPPAETEYRVVRPDGKVRTIRLRCKVLAESDGPVVAAVVEDLSVERGFRTRIALLQQEEQLRAALLQLVHEHTGSGSWQTEIGSGTTQATDSLFRLLGICGSDKEFQPQQIAGLLTGHDQEAFLGALEAGEDADLPLQLRRGTDLLPLRLHLRRRRINEQDYMLALLADESPVYMRERRLQERSALLEAISQSIPEGVLITDLHHNIVFWNRACEELYGVRADAALHRHVFDVLPQLRRHDVIADFERAAAGELITVPSVAHGRGRFFDVKHIPLGGPEGVCQVLHVVHEVTADKQLRERVNERLNFIESLIDASVDRIIVMDRHMNYLYCNEQAARYYGLAADALVGRNLLEVFPDTLRAPAFEYFRKALRGESVHLPATETDPDEIDLSPIKDSAGNVNAVLWIGRSRGAEMALQQERRHAERLLNSLRAGIGEYDKDFRIRYLNDQMVAWTGRTRPELIGKVLWDLFPVLTETPAYAACLRTSRERVRTESEHFSPASNRWVYMSAEPTDDDGVTVVLYDRTDLHQAEQELRAEHARLLERERFIEKVTNATPDFIMVYDLAEGRIVYVNRYPYQGDEARYRETLNISHEEMVARAHPDDQAAVDAFIRGMAHASDDEVRHLDYRVLRDGKSTAYRCTARVFARNESGAVTQVLEVIRDLSDATA